MKIRLAVNGKTKETEAKTGETVGYFLKKSGMNPETVILKRNGKLVHPDTFVKEGDFIELIGIIYGG